MHHFHVSVHTIEPGLHKTDFIRADAMENTLRAVWQRAPQDVVQNEYGADYIEQAIKVMLDQCVNGMSATNIAPVVDCYKHALLAKSPRVRYHPGSDARFLWLPLAMLPDWLTDVIIRQLERLGGVPIPCGLNVN